MATGPGGTTLDQEGFIFTLAGETGIDVDVLRAWVLAESGSDPKPGSVASYHNYLGIKGDGPAGKTTDGFKKYGSSFSAGKDAAQVLKANPNYAPILNATDNNRAINAIATSPWLDGQVGFNQNYFDLLKSTYKRVVGDARFSANPITAATAVVTDATGNVLEGIFDPLFDWIASWLGRILMIAAGGIAFLAGSAMLVKSATGVNPASAATMALPVGRMAKIASAAR